MPEIRIARSASRVVVALTVLVSSMAWAQNCTESGAPKGFGGSWWRSYAAWCSSCNGTPDVNTNSCHRGPNWKGQGQGQGPGGTRVNAAPPVMINNNAGQQQEQMRRQQEEQRQREAEEERERQEAEAAQLRQQEFDRSKAEALGNMKDIARTQFGLKDEDTAGTFALKDDNGAPASGAEPFQLKDSLSDGPNNKPAAPPVCEWGTGDTSVVDLRCLGLDPNKPIAVDPHVVRGQQRVFPAQVDPATFENENFIKGMQAEMRPGAAAYAEAERCFKLALQDRPDDPLVRNAILLAQDIHKERLVKELDDKAHAAIDNLQAYAAIQADDNKLAKAYIAEARTLDPDNDSYKFVESIASVDLGPGVASPERKAAYKIVASSLVSISNQNFGAAEAMLKVAQKMQTRDPFIGSLLQKVREYNAAAGKAAANP
ncbi:MAG: tetratricopeptide repeat protein [Terriglobales bacterium]